MLLTCKEVYVKFTNQNAQQQRINYSEVTAATHLEVSINSELVLVAYMYKVAGDGPIQYKPTKVLIFNKDQVLEVDCCVGVNAEPTGFLGEDKC